jgi:hypothetical protein
MPGVRVAHKNGLHAVIGGGLSDTHMMMLVTGGRRPWWCGRFGGCPQS